MLHSPLHCVAEYGLGHNHCESSVGSRFLSQLACGRKNKGGSILGLYCLAQTGSDSRGPRSQLFDCQSIDWITDRVDL